MGCSLCSPCRERDEARAKGEAACAAWGVDKVKMHDLAKALLEACVWVIGSDGKRCWCTRVDCDPTVHTETCSQARAALALLDDAPQGGA